MKETWKVYIKGVQARGKKVINTLVNLGAENSWNLCGSDPEYIYFISHGGVLQDARDDSEVALMVKEYCREIKLSEQWKNGDVLISKDGGSFNIFRCYDSDSSFFSSLLEVMENVCHECSRKLTFYAGIYRLATPSEIERFHELLHKHGKEWDAEQKQLVDWRWKPKNEEAYYFIDTNTSVYDLAYDENNINDSINVEVGNCFRTRKEAEAMAEKIKKLLKDEKTLTKYYVTFFTGEGYISKIFDIKTLDITAIDQLYDWCEKKTGVKGNIVNITKLEI